LGLNSLELLLIALCAIGVGMAKTGLGGLGMVVVPILANIFGPKSSTGILLLLLIMADFFGVWYYHRHAELKKIIQLMPSALVGILIGVYIGDKISDIHFQILLGAIIISGALMTLIKIDVKRNKSLSILIGFLGGFITMVGNAAGPIMSIYFLSMGFEKNKFIGTAAWFFLFVNIIKVPFHIIFWKTINLDTFMFDIILFPLILVGALIGVWIVKKIPEKPYKIFVITSVFLSTLLLFL
tara:strand:+ start:2422 stop:3141 length:720 start_codon:yes stop_codon:yes gene_type:complete